MTRDMRKQTLLTTVSGINVKNLLNLPGLLSNLFHGRYTSKIVNCSYYYYYSKMEYEYPTYTVFAVNIDLFGNRISVNRSVFSLVVYTSICIYKEFNTLS